MKNHSQLAKDFNKDAARVTWHDETLWLVRQKRDRISHGFHHWEGLRETASQIKLNVLSNLDTYLIQFENNALKNGIKVHWAKDAEEHNHIVLSILKKHQITGLVKSKSMLTEECHMNEFLQKKGIEVIDTDLGERIVQLRKEPPSHIVLPAIHLKKEDVSDTFHQFLGTQKGNHDPQYLTESARQSLRKEFLTKKLAMTGVNFAIAETGEFVVCTNEGNADMGAHLADVHIASMGLEKIIPRQEDLSIFINLLARSATGQPATSYTSHIKSPRKGQEMHIILLDNGRSTQLAKEDFRDALKCIRCGACFNTCPIYRRSGGHSYHTAVAGPIGSILAPHKNKEEYSDLPFASTLCGSCTNVCPVKINIHEQLYKWRQILVKNGHTTFTKKIAIRTTSAILSHPKIYQATGRIIHFISKNLPFLLNNSFNPWYKHREMPPSPKQSFKNWYQSERKKK